MKTRNCLAAALFTLGLQAMGQKPAGYQDSSLPTEARVEDLMRRMTLEEKIAQMDMFAVWDEKKYVESPLIGNEGVGSFIGDVTPERYNEIQAHSEKSRLKIPFLVGVDAAHGHALMSGCTVFPSSITMAATFNPDLVYEAARHSAAEIRAHGNQWTFAPCVDIVHDARFGRTGETYGECPHLSSVLVRKAVQGLQGSDKPGERVAACAKHMLGGGASIGGVNHGNAEISERMMRRDFLPPFRAAIEEGVMTIMPGHNDVNGIPMHASHRILTDIVKNEYGFKGFYITDMGDIENLTDTPKRRGFHHTAADQKDAVRQGINAGIDMHMYSWDREMFVENLTELVREGKVSESRVDDAVRRILTVKFDLGLFENRYVDVKAFKKLDKGRAQETALEAARQSIVLLKNAGGLLPIDGKKIKHILVTGPNADNQTILGDWSGKQPDDHIVTVLEGIREEAKSAGVEVTYAPCGKIKGKKSDLTTPTTDPVTQAKFQEEGGELTDYDIAEAAKKAAACDLAVVMVGGYGLRHDWGMRTYGESADRPSIDFYGRQVELVESLLATGKPVVMLIVNGKPLNNPGLTASVPAIVDLWEPGMYGGRAAAEILFGKVNPSGKLPVTIPQTAGHLPQYYYQTGSRYWTGYGLGSTSADNKPAFCFGHGLSYSNFKYEGARLADSLLRGDRPLVAEVDVTNEGRQDGYETVMAFVNDKVSSVVTPLKQLKAFRKVFVKAGETVKVKLEIPFGEFGLWNEQMEYVVEPGDFDIHIGRSAEDIRATLKATYP